MMHTVTGLVSGRQPMEEMKLWMEENLQDFGPVKEGFCRAVAALEQTLGPEAVQEEVDALTRQAASNLLFCGWLGFKANLDHFTDPAARSFLELDHEVYLQEATARNLPDYAAAQKTRDRFFAALDGKQQASYEAVTEYEVYLETAVPKLAHYYGYLLGNLLLPRLVPGYRPDMHQTMVYRSWLEDYLGEKCLPTVLEE